MLTAVDALAVLAAAGAEAADVRSAVLPVGGDRDRAAEAPRGGVAVRLRKLPGQ